MIFPFSEDCRCIIFHERYLWWDFYYKCVRCLYPFFIAIELFDGILILWQIQIGLLIGCILLLLSDKKSRILNSLFDIWVCVIAKGWFLSICETFVDQQHLYYSWLFIILRRFGISPVDGYILQARHPRRSRAKSEVLRASREYPAPINSVHNQ